MIVPRPGVTATIDIPSYKGWAPERLAPTEQCRDALVSIGAICRTPAGKSAVQQSVSTVTCRRSGDSNTGTKLTRQGKGVVVAIEPTKAYVVDKKGSTTSWEYALNEILTAAPGAEYAEMSLKDRQLWDSLVAELDAKARDASATCGAPIKATMDVASYKGLPADRINATECRGGVTSVRQICETATGKAAVQQSVTTITCRRSADASKGTKITHEGKGLVFSIEPTKAYVVDKKGSTTSWEYALKEVL